MTTASQAHPGSANGGLLDLINITGVDLLAGPSVLKNGVTDPLSDFPQSSYSFDFSFKDYTEQAGYHEAAAGVQLSKDEFAKLKYMASMPDFQPAVFLELVKDINGDNYFGLCRPSSMRYAQMRVSGPRLTGRSSLTAGLKRAFNITNRSNLRSTGLLSTATHSTPPTEAFTDAARLVLRYRTYYAEDAIWEDYKRFGGYQKGGGQLQAQRFQAIKLHFKPFNGFEFIEAVDKLERSTLDMPMPHENGTRPSSSSEPTSSCKASISSSQNTQQAFTPRELIDICLSTNAKQTTALEELKDKQVEINAMLGGHDVALEEISVKLQQHEKAIQNYETDADTVNKDLVNIVNKIVEQDDRIARLESSSTAFRVRMETLEVALWARMDALDVAEPDIAAALRAKVKHLDGGPKDLRLHIGKLDQAKGKQIRLSKVDEGKEEEHAAEDPSTSKVEGMDNGKTGGGEEARMK